MSNYCNNLLNDLVNETGLILQKDYSTEKLKTNSKIEGFCTNDNCTNTFSKLLTFLNKSKNTFCSECNIEKKKNKFKQHNYQTLKNIVDKYQLVLLKDYFKEILMPKTKIEGFCTNNKCNGTFSKSFKYLIAEKNTLCDNCAKEERKEKVKKTCLEKYGVEHVLQATEIRKNIEETCNKKYGGNSALCSKEIRNKSKKTNLKKYGHEFPNQNEEIKNKIKKTNLIKYGDECPTRTNEFKKKAKETNLLKYGTEYGSQSDIFKSKVKETNLKKYGTICSLQNEEVRKKTDITNLEKYGTTCTAQSEIIKQIIIESNIKKYGVDNYAKTQECKDKVKNTCLERFGTEYYLQSNNKKEKSKNTCFDKYGVEYPMQVPEIAEISAINSFSRKEYILPSGKKINIQGYENFGLEKLLYDELIDEVDIITSKKEVPVLWYYDESNNKHRHFVDIYIKSQNRCIEIKSTWTANKKKDCIFLKQKYAKEAGYGYEIWVFDKNKKLVNLYK